MTTALEARFLAYVAISFASLAFGGMALIAIRDEAMAGGMFFLRVKEIIGIFPILYWGMAVPLVGALALTLVGMVFNFWLIYVLAGIMFLTSFAAANCVIILGSMKLLGWR